ncbi:MAG: hypothetical protein ABR936_08850 [Bacteroidota bacterium]
MILVLAIFFAGCHNNVSYDVNKMPDEGMLLNKWQILGPFPADKEEHFLEVDNLHQFGLDEATITFDEFTHIQPKNSPHTFKNQFLVSSNYKTDFNKIFGYTDSTTINGNVYCACVLQSDKERKLKLNFSSDDGSKVWLNHKLILNYDRNGKINYYDNYIDLNLIEGDNLLLIKVNNVRLGWEMFVAVEEETKERTNRFKKTFAREYGKYYLQRSVVTNDSLSLNEGIPPEKYVLTLTTQNNDQVLCDSASGAYSPPWVISKLKDGLNSSTLYARSETFSESFYKGDIIKAIDRIIKRIQDFHLDTDAKRNTDALAYRYRHLLKPENMGKDATQKREWDKKMIFLFSSLNHYYNNLSKGLDPESGATGGLLKTYISPIDDGIQYYQLFIPKNYRKANSIPLVIELPKFMAWHPSPLETYRFANIGLFELFEDMADKYNVIILDPGGRTVDKSNMNTIDEADLWEAIGDVRKKYNIDTTRIYLRGACLACRAALKLAIKYPDRFAAMAFIAPELTVSTIDNVYLQQNEPLNYLKNITNLPLLVIHSKIDPHSPVFVSEKLNEDAREVGLKQFTYRRLLMEFQTYYSGVYMEDVFDFFSKYSLNPSPNELSFSTSQLKYNKSFWVSLNKIDAAKNASIHAKIDNNILTISKENIESYTIDLKSLPYSKDKPLTIFDNGKKVFDEIAEKQSITINPQYNSNKSFTKNQYIEGPFAHAFTVPFTVVLGTIGNKQETKNIQALADTINKYWMLRYYTGCRIRRDKDIVEKDIAEYSLLLIGTPQSNSIFKRLAEQLPIKINNNSIEIGEKKTDGSELGFYLVYPNPENLNKYVGVIGYNNPSAISLGYEDDGKSRYFDDVSNYGWYDFKIWDEKTANEKLSGYFDYYWK